MDSHRLSPKPWQPNYLVLRSLAAQLRGELRRRLHTTKEYDVIDVGCGSRPYESLFGAYARAYVGVDLQPGPNVDVVAGAEALPFEPNSFDVALCSQVLEHSENPPAVVSELHRVLKPGGLALVSTHGVFRYHANPEDYWRWTHAGLAKLFRSIAPWSEVAVYPNGGTATALAYLFSVELEGLAARLRVQTLAAPLIGVLHLVAGAIDHRLKPSYLEHPPALAANYLLVGSK